MRFLALVSGLLEGVGLHRADAHAVDLDVGDGVASVRGDGEGLAAAVEDVNVAGGRDGAVDAHLWSSRASQRL